MIKLDENQKEIKRKKRISMKVYKLFMKMEN